MRALPGQKSSRRQVSYSLLPYDLPPAFPLFITTWKVRDRKVESMHAHNILEIGYCHRGQGRFVIDDRIHSFEAGDVFVINPREFHHAHSIGGKDAWWHFIFLDLAKLVSRTFFDSKTMGSPAFFRQFSGHRFPPGRYPRLCACVRGLLEEYEKKPAFFRESLLAQALTLIVELARTRDPRKDGPAGRHAFDSRIVKALQQLASTPEKPLDITALAKISGLSLPHFRRRFKAVMGQTPKDYASGMRISQAARALADNEKTIAEIAFAHGFESLSSFNRQFRTRLKLSPSEWRQRAAGKAS